MVDIHLEYKLKKSKEKVTDIARNMVKFMETEFMYEEDTNEECLKEYFSSFREVIVANNEHNTTEEDSMYVPVLRLSNLLAQRCSKTKKQAVMPDPIVGLGNIRGDS
ncbi:hypothetical protein Bca4012_084648 [Brassica carinata]|uniref:Uncharacterized protein n=1 Tax=Brassica carinata TaxID=52824 RepID=A0A8X8BCF9_BRACI|nr:hypothetical protein Bca52824_004594 [Brassica carinata]